jgi:hypothetical protein
MIVLNYELSPGWNLRTEQVDLQSADETTLRFDCFLGDVVFLVDEVDFSAPWGWVPVLDFALALRTISGGLVEPEAHERFEFTESDAKIEFRREREIVTVEADYTALTAQISHLEISSHAERFVARVVADLVSRYPALAENPFIVALSGELTTPA